MTDCKIREVKRDETRKGVTAEEQESKFCSLLSNWLNFKQLWQEQSNYRARGAKGEEKEDGERIDEREREVTFSDSQKSSCSLWFSVRRGRLRPLPAVSAHWQARHPLLPGVSRVLCESKC